MLSATGRRTALVALVMLAPLCAQAQSHWPDQVFHDSFEGVANVPATDADASRFLAQATFGPSSDDIAHLRQVGYTAWFNEQFAKPVSTQVPYLDWV